MVNKMLKDATTFVEHLAKQGGTTAPAVTQLKKQLKNFSKNELVRLCTATLIAKNILEAKVNDFEKIATNAANPAAAGTDSQRTAAPEQQELVPI